MTWRSGRGSDVGYILDDLAWQCGVEHEVYGILTRQVYEIALGFFRAAPSWTYSLNGLPACVFGVLPDGFTWFLATKDYFAGPGPVRAARRKLDEVVDRPVFSRSMSTHPGTARWFRLLGFEKVGANLYARQPRIGVLSYLPASVTSEVAAPNHPHAGLPAHVLRQQIPS